MDEKSFRQSVKGRWKSLSGGIKTALKWALLPTIVGSAESDLPVKPRGGRVTVSKHAQEWPAVLSISQRLWNAAYDSLEKDDNTAKLVQLFMETLTLALGGRIQVSPGSHVSPALNDPNSRQELIKELVQANEPNIAMLLRNTKKRGNVTEFILSTKGMIFTAIQNTAQAALPWAGVCVGLQILFDPAKATRSNLAGITHIISRMDWYCALPEYLLDEDSIDVRQTSYGMIRNRVEEKVAALYKGVLLYQMKSVCSYYQKQGLVFLRSLTNWDDWDTDLQTVASAEEALEALQYVGLHARTLEHFVNRANGMEGLLGDIHRSLRDFVALQKATHLDDIERQCLLDLCVVNPKDDLKRIENQKDGLVEPAYKWILDTEEYAAFTRWSDDPPDPDPCQLLWIKGSPGTGKTMLLIGIIRELENRLDFGAPDISYFFFQGTDATTNNATVALRSLIWMLLVNQPHLISHLREKYEDSGASLFRDGNAFFALSEAFQRMLKDPNLWPVYFVVDALDECDLTKPGMGEFVQLVSASLTLSDSVRWLISSRPSANLLAKLVTLKTDNPDISQSLLELDTKNLTRPIDAYVNYKLNALNGKRGYDDRVLAEVSQEVRRRAMGSYLWVAHAFNVLKTVHGQYAVQRLKELPPGLSELYDRAVTRIENVNIAPLCKRVLVAASLAFRPLSLSELAILADIPLDTTATAVDSCDAFLTVSEERVYVIHQTAKDYLMNWLKFAGVAQGHADISRRSMEAMSSILKQNMYDLPFGFIPKDKNPPSSDPLAPIRYSCVFWVDHLCFRNGEIPGRKTALADDGEVLGFLKERFLHWLESLALLGKLSDGVLSIRKLLQISVPGPQLAGFLKDAEKFILSHWSIIERAPLQVYGSALVFSPTMSKVRIAQWKERLPFIETVAGIRDRWDPQQQTLEGHNGSLKAVAFSPDGKMLASASTNRTVWLWDAVMGAHELTLEGHGGSVNAVAFPPDGKTLASASHDRTIRLWDAAIGVQLQTFKGHSGSINAVAFSPDGRTLVSASDDRTVRIWDVVTGSQQQTLEGHSGSLKAVAFSPDGKMLASASTNRTVWLWDAVMGAHELTLEGHGGSVNAVAFSPDGKTLASASDDSTVRLWDVATGTHERTLEGHGDWVNAVAFSPDGGTLVSASDDRTVRIWDMATGLHQQTLEGHTGNISAVDFAPDGKMLASASYDSTVRLWDAAMGAHHQMLEGPGDRVKLVAFSPCGKLLASASYDTTVCLWDAATGAHRRTLKGHTGRVEVIAFSADGQMLASGSDDWTTKLWDTAAGAHWQTLKGHSSAVTAISFSPKGQTLASASNDCTVRLWDIATGAHRRTLEGHTDWVKAITFSPDGKLLASASYDCTVRLWDVATGSLRRTLEGHSDWVNAIAFSPDDRVLASASDDRTIRLWDRVTGINWMTLIGHNDGVNAIAFSPGAGMLASASYDHTIRVWDAATGALWQTIETYRNLTSLAFSEDSQYLKTDHGSLRLLILPTLSDKPRRSPPDPTLWVENEWVTRDAENVLWLPDDYRTTVAATCGRTVVLGHGSGGLTFLQFELP